MPSLDVVLGVQPTHSREAPQHMNTSIRDEPLSHITFEPNFSIAGN
jgi:hypothetical protein